MLIEVSRSDLFSLDSCFEPKLALSIRSICVFASLSIVEVEVYWTGPGQCIDQMFWKGHCLVDCFGVQRVKLSVLMRRMLSNSIHADFCVEVLNEALERYGLPEIMSTDQGSQFAGAAWITTLTEIADGFHARRGDPRLDRLLRRRTPPHGPWTANAG